MPSIEIQLPRWMFAHKDTKQEFIRRVRSIVSEWLECAKDNGAPMGLRPNMIDVTLLPYDPADVALSALIIAEIKAYPIPSRMSNITGRLERIGKEIGKIVPESSLLKIHLPELSELDFVSVRFIEVDKNCWVSVSQSDVQDYQQE